MKRILILFASLVLLLNGCGTKCCTAIVANIALHYQNANDENLLDPRTADALKAEDIEVYVLRNGVRVHLSNPNLSFAKNFKIFGSPTEKYYMYFLFDISKESMVKKKVTMFITYKDRKEDKVVGSFDLDHGNTVLERVWINDIAMVGPSYSPSTAYVIKK
jgi:hypothetical protein